MPDVEAGGGGGWSAWIAPPIRIVEVTNPTGYYDWNTTGNWTRITTSNATTGNWLPWVTSATNDWFYPTWEGQRLVLAEETDIEHATAVIEAAADDVAREDREIERAAAVARNQYLQEERAQRNRERAVAITRGEQLLLSMLDENQREALRQDNMFAVIGSHGTVYQIHRGTSGNIEWIKPDGTVGGRLCAHPTMHIEWLPTEDVMLAQMLALVTDEREFVRVANVHAGSRPPIMIGAAA